MFQVTNTGTGPLIYTDRHGVRMQVNPGTSEELDLDAGTGEFIDALQKAGEPVTISGEAEEGPVRAMGSPMPRGGQVLRDQTAAPAGAHTTLHTIHQAGGTSTGATGGAPGGQGGAKRAALPDEDALLELKVDELKELAEKRDVDITGLRKKEDIIEALQKDAKKNG